MWRRKKATEILDFVQNDGRDGRKTEGTVAGMAVEDREFVVGALRGSEARLVEAVRGVSAEQAKFRPGPERWSIADVLEHLVVWEDFMLGAIERAVSEPARDQDVSEKDGLVLGLAESREKRLKAREAAMPMGRWSDVGEMLKVFEERRGRTLAFAESTDADLRRHFFAHVTFGDLDCYQWLVAMGQHTLRHVGQIEEIRGDMGRLG
jgi:uncharacterized damage-inducible protein DinB